MQRALLQFGGISADLLAMGARRVGSCPKGWSVAAWGGGGGKQDHVGDQHPGTTLVMCLGLRMSGVPSSEDFSPVRANTDRKSSKATLSTVGLLVTASSVNN